MRRKDGGVEAPISLGGLFSTDSDSDSESGDVKKNKFQNEYEVQELLIGDRDLFHI